MSSVSTPRIAIIGAGPAGLCAGIKLKDAGLSNFVIFDKESGIGGTWFNTRYPGLACDLKSHIYSFSFEPNPRWSRTYATQPEILEYLEHCTSKYGLRDHLRLSSEVLSARWIESEAQWELEVAGRGFQRFDILVAAQGMFSRLKWPEIQGIESFEGNYFHAVRWPEGHNFSGERVAVIGTAACAVQMTPNVAQSAERLFVFQRSPAWVMEKDDPVHEPEFIENLVADQVAQQSLRQEYFDEVEAFITFSDPSVNDALKESALRNLALVEDEALRQKLTPDVPLGCLRPLFSSNYYQIYNRDNVELVTDAISHVTTEGIVSEDGTLREVDTIIAATGYQVDKYLSVIPVVGRQGVQLEDAWSDGPMAYMGVMTAGFPNLFMLYGPNTNNGSLLYMFECEADFIVAHVQRMQRESIAISDVRADVMDDYNQWLQGELDNVEVWQASCSNYYRGSSGRIVTQWPKGMTEFRDRLRAANQPKHFDEIPREALGLVSADQ